jgi:hypothetical protein
MSTGRTRNRRLPRARLLSFDGHSPWRNPLATKRNLVDDPAPAVDE